MYYNTSGVAPRHLRSDNFGSLGRHSAPLLRRYSPGIGTGRVARPSDFQAESEIQAGRVVIPVIAALNITSRHEEFRRVSEALSKLFECELSALPFNADEVWSFLKRFKRKI